MAVRCIAWIMVESRTEEYLRNIHATGYISGLNAGALVGDVTSFNSWVGIQITTIQ